MIASHQLSEGFTFSSLITNHEHLVAGLAAHISHLVHPRAGPALGDEFFLHGPGDTGWSGLLRFDVRARDSVYNSAPEISR